MRTHPLTAASGDAATAPRLATLPGHRRGAEVDRPGPRVRCLAAAEAAVLELGATRHEYQPGTTFRVFPDPEGHPFCLCLS